MSYDISTEPDTGLGWNYTYNIQPMTARAGLRSLNDLNGVKANVAACALGFVIARMEDTPGDYRALNPENGWGDFDSFLARLRDLRNHLLSDPDATVRVG